MLMLEVLIMGYIASGAIIAAGIVWISGIIYRWW